MYEFHTAILASREKTKKPPYDNYEYPYVSKAPSRRLGSLNIVLDNSIPNSNPLI